MRISDWSSDVCSSDLRCHSSPVPSTTLLRLKQAVASDRRARIMPCSIGNTSGRCPRPASPARPPAPLYRPSTFPIASDSAPSAYHSACAPSSSMHAPRRPQPVHAPPPPTTTHYTPTLSHPPHRRPPSLPPPLHR